jgi:hypothetical protein
MRRSRVMVPLGMMLAAVFSIASWAMARGDGAAGPDLGRADFRYAPPWWQSAICQPDDPDKILVGKEGQILLDFGRGMVRNFGIVLQADVDPGATWVKQQTVSARAPIVQTFKSADGVEVLEEAFVLVPGSDGAAASSPTRPRITREDGRERLNHWAHPVRPCAGVFRGVDVAYGGRSIQLRLRVPAGAERTLVFGLCEGWHKEPGKRPLILQAEGSEPVTVDPVKDFGPDQPGLYRKKAIDVDRDGVIAIRVSSPVGGPDRNAILNALWCFAGAPPDDGSILDGSGTARAEAFFAGVSLPDRRVVVLLTLRNATDAQVTRAIGLRIDSGEIVRTDAGGSVAVGSRTWIRASEPGGGTLALSGTDGRSFIRLPALALRPGESKQVAWTIDRASTRPPRHLSADQAREARAAARQWWDHADLPFATVQAPDPEIQGMLEACVRNIWQAREIRQDLPAFHVGPTVYRGLWVVDGSFLLEAAAMLGRGQDARAGVEYLLSHQKPAGSFEILPHFWKENGIVLWAVTRHALLTQDKDWLRTRWPRLQAVVRAIQALRARASTDAHALEFGLLPPGEIDGGISNSTKPEYSNTYWCLAGLKAAIAAARWLGKSDDASAWQKEYDDFLAVYRKAATRDTLRDASGNAYVPTMMGNIDHHVPQRGQWAFCHAVYPGGVFAPGDPLAAGQLAMLRATKAEGQGLVYDTGWMRQGIWTYFASFYGHAVLWNGQGREAAQVLYDFARHASPVRTWREEQKPVGKGQDEVGDMPHNWASAEFIRLCTHLIELDRDHELHLLEGFPREWAGPGMVTRLSGVLTPFGPLHMELRTAADGKTARLTMARLKGPGPARIVLHLAGLTGREQTLELPTDRDIAETIAR